MTRETKIGLLVGLAFIIVIGILLSDHLTSSTEPPPAPLTSSGNSVMGTVRSPGVAQSPIVTNVEVPRIQPKQTVLTQRETQPPTAANEVVKIGGPSVALSNQAMAVQTQTPTEQAAPVINIATPAPAEPIRVNQQPTRTIAQNQPEVAGADAPNSAIEKIARAHGETIVSMTPGGSQTAANASNSGVKEYVAEPGDSLSKIAARFYGTSTKARKDAIVAANPSLASDPNKVVVGKSYRIPALATDAAQPAQAPANTVAQAPAAQPKPSAQPQQQPQKSSANENWYVVQSGDTLTRIAREQLGDAGAIPAIIELNRETLKDPNNLNVNMKLRLPGKSVAQAN